MAASAAGSAVNVFVKKNHKRFLRTGGGVRQKGSCLLRESGVIYSIVISVYSQAIKEQNIWSSTAPLCLTAVEHISSWRRNESAQRTSETPWNKKK